MLAAMLACVAVATAGLRPLLSPVGTVVRQLAALPMRAALAAKVVGEPLQPATVATESLGGFAWPHLALTAAVFAGVFHAAALASLRAMGALGRDSRRQSERLAAGGASLRDGHAPFYSAKNTRSIRSRFDHSPWFVPYVAGYYAHLAGLPEDRGFVMVHARSLIAWGQGKELDA